MKKDTSFATASLVCGILSIVPLLNLVTTILGVIFGIMALVRIKKQPQKYGGQIRAIIGLVLSAVWVVMTVYALVVYGPEQLLTRQ